MGFNIDLQLVGVQRRGLTGGSISLDVGFGIPKDCFEFTLHLLLVDQDVSAQRFLTCMLYCQELEPSEMVSPIKCFLFKFPRS